MHAPACRLLSAAKANPAPSASPERTQYCRIYVAFTQVHHKAVNKAGLEGRAL